MESMASRIMLYGILIQKRSLVMHDDQERGLEEEEEEGGREGCHPILPYLPVLMKMSFICAPTSLISKLVPSRHLDCSFAADTVVCTWRCKSTNEYGVFGILRRKLTLLFSHHRSYSIDELTFSSLPYKLIYDELELYPFLSYLFLNG